MKKVWRVIVDGKSFSMICMDAISEEEALRFVRAKWAKATVL